MTKSERDARDAADFRLIVRKRLDVYKFTDRGAVVWCAWQPDHDNDAEGLGRTLHAALNKLRRARGWK